MLKRRPTTGEWNFDHEELEKIFEALRAAIKGDESAPIAATASDRSGSLAAQAEENAQVIELDRVYWTALEKCLSLNDVDASLNCYSDALHRAFDDLTRKTGCAATALETLLVEVAALTEAVETRIKSSTLSHGDESAAALAAARLLWLRSERQINLTHAATTKQLVADLRDALAEETKRRKIAQSRLNGAYQALHEHESIFSTALGELHDHAMFMFDALGRITNCNQAAAEMSGFSSDQLVGFDRFNLYLPEDVAAGLPQRDLAAARNNGRIRSEGWRVKRDGGRFWAHFILVCRKDHLGEPCGFVEIVSDMAREGRISRQLREEEDKFRAIFFNSMEIAVILRLTDCRYLEVNDAACKAYGLRPEEVIGRTPLELNVLAEPDEFAKMVDELQRNGAIKNFELLTRRHDGQLLPVLLSAVVLTIGNERCCLVTARDIGELKRAEEERTRAFRAAERAASLKAEVISLVSHELRTPLNVLLGSFELAPDYIAGGDYAALTDLLAASNRAARRLTDTINHIIDLSRIDSGNFELRPESVNLRQTVDTVIDSIRESAERKGIRLSICNDAPDATMEFDRECLTKALYNLVDNAIKFTICGEVEIRIYRAADNRICLSVRDSGIGIDPTLLQNIFEPFFQASYGLARRHQGSGLGLAVTKRYIDLNRAEIFAASEPGKGSFFIIQQALPAERIALADCAPAPNRDSSIFRD